jgi:hypothetical protein
MQRAVAVCVFVSSLLLAGPAFAADFGVGLKAGTYGLGAEFGVGFSSWFTLRATATTGDLSGDYDEDGIDYDASLDVGGYGLLADFFPMKGTFRLTAGLLSNRNEIGLEAVPTAPIEIGGTTYPPAAVGTLSGDIEFDSSVPYFGVGWGNVAKGRRFGFLVDLGFIHQGAGNVTLSSSTGLVSQSDLDAEAAAIEDDIQDYDFWPIVSFGLAIRFG